MRWLLVAVAAKGTALVCVNSWPLTGDVSTT
jgi:hypothetical protein